MISTGPPPRPFHPVTIAALNAEFIRAQVKHSGRPATLTSIPDAERLANIVEEVGEIARCLTYDTSREGLVAECIQAAAMCLAFAEQEEHQVAQRDHAEAQARIAEASVRETPPDHRD